MKRSIFIVIICLFSGSVFAQGIFKNDGFSSIFPQEQSDVDPDSYTVSSPNVFFSPLSISTEQKSLEYSNSYKLGSSSFNLGLNVSAKSNSSIATLFNNNNVSAGAKAGFTFGHIFLIKNKKEKDAKTLIKDKVKKKPDISADELQKLMDEHLVYDGFWLYVSPQYEGKAFYNYIINSSFADELIPIRKTTNSLTLGINYFNENFLSIGSAILGFSNTWQDADNFSSLKEVSITNTIKSSDTLESMQVIDRTTTQKISAFQGEYLSDISKRIYSFDFYIAPEFIPAIGLLINHTINRASEESNMNSEDWNLGLFFVDKVPLSPNFGIIFKFADIDKELILPEGSSRFSISLTSQFNLGRLFKGSEKKKDDDKK